MMMTDEEVVARLENLVRREHASISQVRGLKSMKLSDRLEDIEMHEKNIEALELVIAALTK